MLVLKRQAQMLLPRPGRAAPLVQEEVEPLGLPLTPSLSHRVIGKYKLFPPIPRIKDKLTDNHQSDQQMIWEKFPPSAGRGDNEEVLTVEEVTEAPTSP